MDAARRINRERVAVLGWGRAILLQFAHPLIAAGVAQHSSFDTGPLSRLGRLRGTVRAMLDFTFGDDARAAAAAARINAIHTRVNGLLADRAGGFEPGMPYSATDPALLVWVHSTLLDSVLVAFERFVGPLSASEKDDYCAAAGPSTERLGVPRAMLPRTAADLATCLERTWASGRIEVTPTARRLARNLLFPPLFDPTRPGAWLNRIVTLGLLPPPIRASYGFPWTARHDRSFRIVAWALRHVLPFVPGFLRYWPEGRSRLLSRGAQ